MADKKLGGAGLRGQVAGKPRCAQWVSRVPV